MHSSHYPLPWRLWHSLGRTSTKEPGGIRGNGRKDSSSRTTGLRGSALYAAKTQASTLLGGLADGAGLRPRFPHRYGVRYFPVMRLGSVRPMMRLRGIAPREKLYRCNFAALTGCNPSGFAIRSWQMLASVFSLVRAFHAELSLWVLGCPSTVMIYVRPRVGSEDRPESPRSAIESGWGKLLRY